MSVLLDDYIEEHGYKLNEQGFKFVPPEECEGKDVDIILTGTIISRENPYGYEVKHNQNPREWDWQIQSGVYVKAWRLSR